MKIVLQGKFHYYAIVFVLLLLMSLAQFSLSIYFPAIPQIISYYQIKHSEFQLFPVFYLLTFGISHLFYGTLSDLIGRKKLLVLGVVLFCASTMIIYFTNNFITTLISFILMGFGIASGSALTGSILSDLTTGKQLTSALSTIGIFTIITPLMSPIVGVYFQGYFGWKSIFLFLSMLSLLSVILIIMLIPETHIVQKKMVELKAHSLLLNYQEVLSDKHFQFFGLIRILVVSGGTAYALNSPYLFMVVYSLSAKMYTLLTVITGSGFLLGSLVLSCLDRYIKQDATPVKLGSYCIFISASLLLIFFILKIINPFSIVVCMTIYMIGNGIIYPSSQSIILSKLNFCSGAASALLGACQNSGRAALSYFVGQFSNVSSLVLSLFFISIVILYL